MVALYWFENFLFTYWFMSDVLPTLKRARHHVSGTAPKQKKKTIIQESQESKDVRAPH